MLVQYIALVPFSLLVKRESLQGTGVHDLAALDRHILHGNKPFLYQHLSIIMPPSVCTLAPVKTVGSNRETMNHSLHSECCW